MGLVSVFNDVMGQVLRGPSSSHNAGAYRIGSMVRSLVGDAPSSARVTFDPEGSYAPTYIPLGVDLAFTAGLMGWSMLDERYLEALERAAAAGVAIVFEVAGFFGAVVGLVTAPAFYLAVRLKDQAANETSVQRKKHVLKRLKIIQTVMFAKVTIEHEKEIVHHPHGFQHGQDFHVSLA